MCLKLLQTYMSLCSPLFSQIPFKHSAERFKKQSIHNIHLQKKKRNYNCTMVDLRNAIFLFFFLASSVHSFFLTCHTLVS